MNKTIYAKYGSTVMKKRYCPDCKSVAFVIKGLMACCDRKENSKVEGFEVICGSKRKRCPKEIQKRLLQEQDGKCFYCDLPYGTPYLRNEKLHLVRVAYDHFVPYSYSQANSTENWVASCRLCNSIKSSKVFETKQDAKDFIIYRRSQKGISF